MADKLLEINLVWLNEQFLVSYYPTELESTNEHEIVKQAEFITFLQRFELAALCYFQKLHREIRYCHMFERLLILVKLSEVMISYIINAKYFKSGGWKSYI